MTFCALNMDKCFIIWFLYVSLNFFCSSLHHKTGQFVLLPCWKQTPILLSGKKTDLVPNLTRWPKSWKADRYWFVGAEIFQTQTVSLDPAFEFQMNEFRVRSSPGFRNTHTHTSAVPMLGSCFLAWLVRSVARTTAVLTSHSPECYPRLGTRGAPWTDIPTAKKNILYVLRSTLA